MSYAIVRDALASTGRPVAPFKMDGFRQRHSGPRATNEENAWDSA